jgi:hypothetical protein
LLKEQSMNTKKLMCFISALALATGAFAQSQSLAELAKQEKQRRAKLRASGGSSKLYTEGDKSGGATATGETTAADAAGGSSPVADGSKKKAKSPEEIAAEKQQEWADKVKKVQDEIKSVEDAITRNERSLASMYNITPARADMANAVEADKQRVAALRQSLAALEEERRRAGLPRPR